MKKVTIESVKARIAHLETCAQIGGRLSMGHEFEMACLRMLLASLEQKPGLWEIDNPGEGTYYSPHGPRDFETVAQLWYAAPPPVQAGVDDDVRNVITLLENNEWAEHCTETELGQSLESEITRLYNWRSSQPAPVKYNIGEATMLHIFTATGMTDVSDMQAVFDRVESVLVKMERKPKVIEPEGWREMMARLANGLELMTSLAAERACIADESVCKAWVTMARVMLNQAQEPATDNTAQQFEALATSAGSGKP